jgi:hypothetical protein
MLARLLTVLVASLALAPAAAAAPAPNGLHGFLLRATESSGTPHTFARTPSFGWNTVRGAARYELQLSTSRNFTENGIVWESEQIRAPLATIPLTLPWVSSPNYSWYARVRAIVGGNVSAWSDKYGFNLRSPSPPASLSTGVVNPHPGLVRWTPVAGATAYEVSFIYDPTSGASKKIKSATTAADLREYYSFHNDPSFFDNGISAVEGEVWWRVRAVREVFGAPMNDIKVVSYGPWSTLFRQSSRRSPQRRSRSPTPSPAAAPATLSSPTSQAARATRRTSSHRPSRGRAAEVSPPGSTAIALASGSTAPCSTSTSSRTRTARIVYTSPTWSEAPHTSRAYPGRSPCRQIPRSSLQLPACISKTPRKKARPFTTPAAT